MKIHTLQGLRAVAALLVVFVHLSAPYGIEARYIHGSRLVGWMHLPGFSGVDLFFVISGAIMIITNWDRFGRRGSWGDFLYRRVTRIYPLYWIVTALIVVVFLVRHGLVNSHSPYPAQVIPSFLILPQRGDPYVGVGWTLVYEMYFYVVFTFALLFSRRRLPWIIGGWAAVTVLMKLAVPVQGRPFFYVVSNPLNLEFVFGMVVGYLIVQRRLVAPRALLGAAAIAVVALLAYGASRDQLAFFSVWFRVFAVGLAFAVVVYGAVGAELMAGVRVPRPVERLGDASYSLYLWHLPILSALGLVAARIVPASPVTHVLALVALVGITVAASLWLYEVVERPLLRAFRRRSHVASA